MLLIPENQAILLLLSDVNPSIVTKMLSSRNIKFSANYILPLKIK